MPKNTFVINAGELKQGCGVVQLQGLQFLYYRGQEGQALQWHEGHAVCEAPGNRKAESSGIGRCLSEQHQPQK